MDFSSFFLIHTIELKITALTGSFDFKHVVVVNLDFPVGSFAAVEGLFHSNHSR